MSWDDEDFEPLSVSGGIGHEWEGEDEDLSKVKDSWDAPSDEETRESKQTVTLEKKKPKAERVAEKKKERRLHEQAEAEEKKESKRQLTAEEEFTEKQRRRKLQEESDLKVAQDLFGDAANSSETKGACSIDDMNPTDDEGFKQLREALVKKITRYERRLEFVSFLENLCRDCCAGLNSESVRQIASALSTLAQEKQRQSKTGTKAKKKGKGPAIGKASAKFDYTAYDDEVGDEFGDFM
ncbi:eukaryotic translation initiation factor 3 subunit J-like [Corticium candelabrum]|uniref:eukaryotic translation initiation factor 3 subunit J-like n=1 Tax=Corticium candelabrum TaxID=121492 RepID=UPI002E26ED7C|nr:eukaryotic translation initiation factor 3 subunit J-like [Corticium candelabrum]